MTFTSDDEQGTLSPGELKKKLQGRELSEVQRMMGEIITENENIEYMARETCKEEPLAKDSDFVVPEKDPPKPQPLPQKYKLIAVAAAAIFVLTACLVATPLHSIVKEAVADKSDEKYQVEENDYSVSGEGTVSAGDNVETTSASTDVWAEVADKKNFLPELLIPQYIPEGVTFVSLDISKWEANSRPSYNVSYSFKTASGDSINISQQKLWEGVSEKNIGMQGNAKRIDLGNKEILYQYDIENANTIICTAIIDDKSLSIIGSFTEEDAVEILKNLK